MKVGEVLFGAAMFSVALGTIAANRLPLTSDNKILSHEAPRTVEPSTALPLVQEDKVFSSAYYDTVAILSADNRCSEFFGGPSTVDIFNQIIAKMRKDYLPANIGIRMSGTTASVINTQTNRAYRLFEKVAVNGNGPFYRTKYPHSDQSLPGIGTYEPASRESRVLMLLHELGHTVKADDGEWYCRNDGKDEILSRRNSLLIEKVCGEEIANLGNTEGSIEVMAQAPASTDH
jgi:hypothetical protein